MATLNKLDVDVETSARLARIPQRNTSIERSVRRYLYQQGLRFRISNRDLPGSPDIANRSRRWSVFVHGCFWHHHEGCNRATIPKRNREFWREKFEANRLRDKEAIQQLRRLGFLCVIVWECEVKNKPKGLKNKLAPIISAF